MPALPIFTRCLRPLAPNSEKPCPFSSLHFHPHPKRAGYLAVLSVASSASAQTSTFPTIGAEKKKCFLCPKNPFSHRLINIIMQYHFTVLKRAKISTCENTAGTRKGVVHSLWRALAVSSETADIRTFVTHQSFRVKRSTE